MYMYIVFVHFVRRSKIVYIEVDQCTSKLSLVRHPKGKFDVHVHRTCLWPRRRSSVSLESLRLAPTPGLHGATYIGARGRRRYVLGCSYHVGHMRPPPRAPMLVLKIQRDFGVECLCTSNLPPGRLRCTERTAGGRLRCTRELSLYIKVDRWASSMYTKSKTMYMYKIRAHLFAVTQFFGCNATGRTRIETTPMSSYFELLLPPQT